MSNKVTIKVELEFELESFSEIGQLVNWANADEKYQCKSSGTVFTLEHFLVGAAVKELDRIKTINEIFCELKSRPIRSPKKIKNNFKELLKLSGLKQQDLSNLTGISNSELSIVLNNKRFISMEYFLLIWTSLGCPPIEKCFELEKNGKKYNRSISIPSIKNVE